LQSCSECRAKSVECSQGLETGSWLNGDKDILYVILTGKSRPQTLDTLLPQEEAHPGTLAVSWLFTPFLTENTVEIINFVKNRRY